MSPVQLSFILLARGILSSVLIRNRRPTLPFHIRTNPTSYCGKTQLPAEGVGALPGGRPKGFTTFLALVYGPQPEPRTNWSDLLVPAICWGWPGGRSMTRAALPHPTPHLGDPFCLCLLGGGTVRAVLWLGLVWGWGGLSLDLCLPALSPSG